MALHHDAAACALAEWRWGPNAGADGLAYLTCGTGFGCGLVLGGSVRYALDGRSPEIGHVRYRDEGPAIFGKPGSYEGYGSANALGLLLTYRRPKDFPIATPVQVIDEIRRNNPDAKWALTENERAVGTACAMLVDLLALDCIVLGTLATYLGDPWVARVRELLPRRGVGGERRRVRGPRRDAERARSLRARDGIGRRRAKGVAHALVALGEEFQHGDTARLNQAVARMHV